MCQGRVATVAALYRHAVHCAPKALLSCMMVNPKRLIPCWNIKWANAGAMSVAGHPMSKDWCAKPTEIFKPQRADGVMAEEPKPTQVQIGFKRPGRQHAG